MTYDEQLRNLPRYVFFDKHRKNFPSRKINFIRKNREFYCKYKNILDTIILELKKYPLSFQKFEWNCK
jgi:DNA (cytosine-5)-methyltransferase 1